MTNEKIQINVTDNTQELILRSGEAPAIYQYKGYKYVIHSLESFIAAIKAKASLDCVIAYSKSSIQAILDDKVIDRQSDKIEYAFNLSNIAKEWTNIFGKNISQREFIDFLKNKEVDEFPKRDELLAQIKQFQYITSIHGDFNISDNNNYSFAIKVNEAEGTIKIPTNFDINISVLKETTAQTIPIELVITKPKSEGEKPFFTLVCPKWIKIYDDAVENQITQLRKELPSNLILAGVIF